ncbi:MAG: tetratricopeptide repeat protein [bacterium]|nr:tetratricopeptide repeat protein [bacterium]
MVKIHDPGMLWLKEGLKRLTRKKVTVEQLRFQLDQTPSFSNTLSLAQALHDRELFSEAAELFERALKIDSDSKAALYGLALCLIGLHDHVPAIGHLRELIALEPSFQDYAAWSNLAYALSETGRQEEALELLGRLVDSSPRLTHRLLYAHYLMQDGLRERAREQIEEGLIEYRQAPPFLKRRNRAYARQAKRMLRQLTV